MNAFEFEITIQSNSGNNSWPVVVKCKQPNGLTIQTKGIFQLNEYDWLNLIQAHENEKEYGTILGKNLFKDSIKDVFIRALSNSISQKGILRILLSIEADEKDKIRTFHWERLCAPIDADGSWNLLARDQRVPFSIYIPTIIDRSFPPIGRKDLRALVLVASPSNLEKYKLVHFDIEEALSGIKEALGDEIPYDVLANNIDGVLGPPTLQELSKQLTIASKQYTLLHIVCHGMVSNDSNGETSLFWATEDNQVLRVTGTELIEELRFVGKQSGLPHFAFFCTCESADPRAEGALGGLGQRLVRDLGMPAVVAMTRKVSVNTALAFGQSFYRRLRQSGEVDVALQEATAGLGDCYDITVPALFSRLGGRPLFSDRLENRELTAPEIDYGIDKLRTLLQERAPNASKLKENFETQVNILNKAQKASSQVASNERKQALLQLNIICEQLLDFSFDELATSIKEPPKSEVECPFPGLSSFGDKKYHKFFFGRDHLIEELKKQLEVGKFLVVVGASGSGKSSVVLAGLLPKMQEQEPNLQSAYLTPGREPLKQLEKASKELSEVSEAHSILIVDQFEELFTLCQEPENRQNFITKLLKLAEHRKVVITMREDFLKEFMSYNNLKEWLETGKKSVEPMKPAELITVMKMQADKAGLRFQPGLSNLILNDVQKEPGAMPLLQYALRELWKRRRGRWLCVEEYEEIGGVEKAIAKTADDFYNHLSQEEQQQVKNIFLRLIRLDESDDHQQKNGRNIRRRMALEDLTPAGDNSEVTRNLVNHLADEGARLVVTGKNKVTDKEEVEIAHEALIRHWPKLEKWLKDNHANLQLRDEIYRNALKWKNNERKASYLNHRDERVDEVKDLSEQPSFLNQLEADYVNACVDLRERLRIQEEEREVKEREKDRKLSITLWSLMIGGIALVTISYLWNSAQKNQIKSLSASSEARFENDQLGALLSSLKAAKEFQQFLPLRWFDKQLGIRTQAVLQQTLYQIQEKNRLENLEEEVSNITISQDGRFLAIAGEKLYLWDLKNHKLTTLYEVPVRSVSFSPDNQKLVSAGDDGMIRLWELPEQGNNKFKPKLLKAWNGFQGGIKNISFSPESDKLAVAGTNNYVTVWNLNSILQKEQSSNKSLLSSSKIPILPLPSRPSWNVIFNPKNNENNPKNNEKQLAITGLDSFVDILHLDQSDKPRDHFERFEIQDNSSNRQYKSAPWFWLRNMSFSRDGKYLAIANIQGTVCLYKKVKAENVNPDSSSDCKYSILVKPFPPAQPSNSPAQSSNSPTQPSNSPTQPSNLSKTWNLVKTWKAKDSIWSIEVSPDNQLIAIGEGNGSVSLWTLEGQEVAVLKGHRGAVVKLSFSEDGQILAASGNNGSVRLWNLQRQQFVTLKSKQTSLTSVSFSPDGQFIATAGTKRVRINEKNGTNDIEGIAELWNLQGKKLKSMEKSNNSWLRSVSFSPDSQFIAATGNKTAPVWNLQGRKFIELESDQYSIQDNGQSNKFEPFDKSKVCSDPYLFCGLLSLSFNSKSNIAIAETIGISSFVNIFDLKGKQLESFNKYDPYQIVRSVNFSPDGKLLVGAGDTGIIRLFDWENGKLLTPTNHSTATILSSSFNPQDGKQLATAGIDGTIRLWTLEDNSQTKPSKILSGHQGWVNSVSFSPDGKRLASAGEDGSVRLWNWQGKDEEEQQLATWKTYQGSVNSISFSPDGKYLASAGDDGSAILWPIESFDNLDYLIQQGCHWIRDYLKNPETNLSWSDRQICDGVGSPENQQKP